MNTDQQLNANPVKVQAKADGFASPKIATEEALDILKLQPIPTVWARNSGRPVYDRLPAISQQYKKGYDRDQAYVYLEPKFGKPFGAGSLQVGKRENEQNILFVESGEITSALGPAKVGAYEVDISTLDFGNGLIDGVYQVGYILSKEIPEAGSDRYSLIRVENSELGLAYISVGVSSATRGNEGYRAISETGSWVPNSLAEAGSYEPGSWFVIDFQESVQAEEFVVVADLDEAVPTSKVALEWSDDAIVWNKVEQKDPTDNGWVVSAEKEEKHRYWKLFFWDDKVAVKQILYTGEALFPDNRISSEVIVATPYLENFFDEIEGNYLLLASIEVKNNRVGTITDYRRISTVRYDPVADWLTSFQDDNLNCLFDDVEKYSAKFLAPPTADYHLYEELDDSACFGLGEFDLSEDQNLRIIFPDEVGLGSGSSVEPNQVILVEDPETPSDLATQVYTEDYLTLSWSIDNGIY